MRNMSFALTTQQVRDRTKTVTRRLKWLKLRPGQLIQACVKCMGLRPGEQIERLAVIRIVKVTREPLWLCDDEDAAREGFPELTGSEFVEMFCRHMGGAPGQTVTRIEFRYIVGGRSEWSQPRKKSRSSSGATKSRESWTGGRRSSGGSSRS